MASVRWRSRRLVLVVAAAALTAAMLAPAASGQGSSGGFGDVPADSYYSDAVALLAADGVFADTDCAEGFCPGEVIDRKTMAVWLVRILDGTDPAAVTTSRFDDVDVTGFHAPFIERMADLEVTRGCGDLSGFCPHRAVTRAQMAVFLSRAFDLADGPDPGFGDVPADAWYRAEVARLAASGITVGCGDGSNFCPGRDTTRAQMATFLARATGKIPTPGRVTQAPAVLLSFTLPEAAADDQVWPSPDWRHVAYLANVTADYEYGGWKEVGDLYVAARDGSKITKVASDVLGDEGCQTPKCGHAAAWWSPDSSRLWYVTVEARDPLFGRPTQYALRVATADGASSVQITQPSPGINRDFAYSGGWSPDSQHLAYSTEDKLFRTRADGTNPTKLTDNFVDIWSRSAWSPDSSRIAYSKRDEETQVDELFTARADGTNPTKLTDDYANGGFNWSADSSRIAYGSRDDETEDYNFVDGYELFTARADGTNPTKLTDNLAWFSLSPDGSHIAYNTRDDEPGGFFEGYELFVARADGTNSTKLADNIIRYAWSPDSSRIAYSTMGQEFFTIRADGANPTKLADYIADFVWSPDSSRIAYRTAEEFFTEYGESDYWEWGLVTARADGANTTQLVDDYIEDYVWSPESSRVAYITLEHEDRSADYDHDDPDTWPDSHMVMTAVDTDGGNPVALGRIASYKRNSVRCLDITLAWQSDGIFFNVRPIARSSRIRC